MKRVALMAGLLVLAAGTLRAQMPAAAARNLSLEVRSTGSGGGSSASSSLGANPGGVALGGGWTTMGPRNYTQKREQESAAALEVQVRNVSHDQQAAKLEWIFYSRKIDGKGGEEIFDRGSQQVDLAGGTAGSFAVASKELHNSVVKHLHTETGAVPTASVHKDGSKVAGWIVRLVADGKVIAVKASAPSLEGQGTNPEL